MNPASPLTFRTLKSLGQPRLVGLVLCLMAWRGPVPVVHSHHTGFSAGSAVEHLDRYHQAEPGASTDWHFHVMLWQDVLPACPTDQTPVPSSAVEAPSQLGGVIAAPLLSGEGRVTGWGEFSSRRVAAGRLDRALGGQPALANFLSSQLFTRPACAVLSISRC